jgi:segregation and condensation protein A
MSNSRLFAEKPFEEERSANDPVCMIDLDGFSGPLDLLLELARRQKVDLAKISILTLVEQYLSFIEEARALRLELAADYLVMAAWLAFLKSRLLLPAAAAPDEPNATDLAAALANRLKRLEAIRAVSRLLQERPQLNRDIFSRGDPEPIALKRISLWEASIHDLLSAYAQQRQVRALARISLKKRTVWSLDAARAALERLIGTSTEWAALDDYLITFMTEPGIERSVRATSLSATLELVKEGRAEIRQERTFAPIFMRALTVNTERSVA